MSDRSHSAQPDDNSPETEQLLDLAKRGDDAAVGHLLEKHRDRISRAVRVRMHPALASRIDVDDVLQQTCVEAIASLDGFLAREHSSFFLWLRRIALRCLTACHREHLGAQARDVRREARDGPGAGLDVTSQILVEMVAGLFTSPSSAAARAERENAVERALETLEPNDREILALRHFEQLSNAEAAEVLGLEPSATSKRHVRALRRLRELLREFE